MRFIGALPLVACSLVAPSLAQKTAGAPAPDASEVQLNELLAKRYWLPYFFHQEAPGVWSAVCRDQGLWFQVSANGLAVSGSAPFDLFASCTSFGRGDARTPLGSPAITRDENHLDLAFGAGLEGWYENGPRGLEQGWTIAAPPPGAAGDPVAIELAFTGSLSFVLDADACGGVFEDDRGGICVWYRDLEVRDAAGVKLSAWLAPASNGIDVLLEVDDRNASYPITVDPLFAGPVWSEEIDQSGAAFGSSVASAGDVNGDGYDDLVAGAPAYANGQASEGAAFVYLGSRMGLGSSPAWTVEGDQAGAEFGASVAGAGDVDGDGYDDVLVGAPSFSSAKRVAGRVFLFRGSASGLATTPSWTADGSVFCQMFGASVAGAGDVDNDSYDDVLVGSTGGPAGYGSACIYLGSPNGLGSLAAWSVSSSEIGAGFGAAVAAAGDVNLDGHQDVAVGSPFADEGAVDAGAAYLYLGSASGPSTSPSWSVKSARSGARYGAAIAGAGDANGDGYDDLIVGAPYRDETFAQEGRAYLYLGGASGLANTHAWSATSGRAGARFGSSVGSAGDPDRDGFADVLVGAPFDTGSFGGRGGRAYAYRGTPSGLTNSPAWSDIAPNGSRFGTSVAALEDANGDGFPDAAVGDPGWSNPSPGEGRVVLYSGNLVPPIEEQASWTIEGNQTDARLGWSVSDAGDVDGDGYADVIAGAPFFDSGQADEGAAFVHLGSPSGLASAPSWIGQADQVSASYGDSVSLAGDVNGDGYADVIVGAPLFDAGQADEGAAFVHLGSPSGLANAPSWIGEADQVSTLYGDSVSAAGDVNGDGYDDVIVGARTYDAGQTDEGRAFVYLGSQNGLVSIAAWTAESDQADAWFGIAVASAGDVNADGYLDVIIGASQYDATMFNENDGAAFVYLGGPGGLPVVPSWMAIGGGGYYLGTAVASAGDPDADGFDDVLVTAGLPAVVYLFRGGSIGLESTPAWNQSGIGFFVANFGFSTSTAGDVNGDGYDDVLIGAPHSGPATKSMAFLFLGSSLGLLNLPAWTFEDDQLISLGWSVSTAGDVDGDGDPDVIVGAPLWDGGLLDEGTVLGFLAIPPLPLAPLHVRKR